MTRKLLLLGLRVVEERTSSSGPRNARKDEAQIVEPAQRRSVEQRVHFRRAGQRVRRAAFRLHGYRERHVLRPERSVRVVLLVARVFWYSVRRARTHRVVLVRIGKAVPRQSDSQFQFRKVQ